MIPTKTVRVSLDQLPIGFTCEFDIHDDEGLLLLRSGSPLTEASRDQIVKRGVSSVAIPHEAASQFNTESRPSSDHKEEAPSAQLRTCDRRAERSGESYSAERSERFSKLSASAISAVSQIASQIRSLSINNVTNLCTIPAEFTDMLLEDSDQSIYELQRSSDPTSLANRCAEMSMLAINTAIEMDLPDQDIVNVGIAGLLHDLGLYEGPTSFRDPTKALSEEEVWEYRQHPTRAMELFSNFTAIPDEVSVIIAHVHEKPNGSGYPRGLRANLLHPLSRILSVVDTYQTLVRPGPGRPAMIPHDAMCLLLLEGKRGCLDGSVMRAFLTQLTLFPIGSQVELDNGKRAIVIRRDHGHYTSPVVKLADSSSDEMVALSNSSIGISHPIADDSSAQMRVTTDMMSSLDLESFERV